MKSCYISFNDIKLWQWIVTERVKAMNLKLIKGMRLVLATHNPGKVPEIEALLGGHYSVVTAGSLNLPEPDETESTFVGNALLKARHAADLAGEVAIADDSGLSIAALDGAPGIFSARWAGPDKDFAFAMKKVEQRLEEIGAHDPSAWFTSALAVAWPNGPAVVVEGRVDGTLTFPPRGTRGFGYDPIFIPEGHDQTFGELDPAFKDSISHRARAFEKLRDALID